MTKYWIMLLMLVGLPFSVSAQDSDTTTTVEEATETTETETAQETQPVSSPSAQGVEKIEVTGSHIKRINVEGPSPVLTLDREYLQRSGYNSVADVLRDSTITATGVGREAAGTGTAGAATTGLRGFGSDKILVLLNGQRLPKIGGGNSVDLNLIPFQAVERVEILKDGASAVYGSDALAGVINFITKKDFDGATIMVRRSEPQAKGGARTDIAGVYGKNFSKGNFMAIYQYRSNEEIWDKDRPWSNGQLSPTGSPGSWRPAEDTKEGGADDDLFRPDPRCSGPTLTTSDGVNCAFDYSPYSWSLPAIEQHSGVITGEYELNESLKLYTNLFYTRRTANWQYAPAPDTFADDRNPDGSGNNFEIPSTTATEWGLNSDGEPIDVRYRLVDELGPRSTRETTDSYGAVVGIKGYMLDTWEWDYTVNHGASSVFSHGHSGYANKRILYNLMTSSPSQFNPFSADAQDVTAADHDSEQWTDSSLTTTQFRASGELANIGSGILSSAFGVSASWEDYQQKVDTVTAAGDLFGGAGANGQGSRSYQSLFAELGYTFDNWEFQLAGRFDRYSDFGETFNPKFAFRYNPISQLLLRGSIGTGFKAPTLDELYSAQGYGFPFYVDFKACDAAGGPSSGATACEAQQYRTLSGGNPNLEEETSLSYNFGGLLQVTRDLSFGLDYWHTKIENAIGLDLNSVMMADAAGTSLPSGISVNRSGSGGITSVIAPLVNTATQDAKGLDFTFDYTLRLGSITLTPHMDHSQYLEYKEEPLPGVGVQDRLGWAGRPRWRNTSYLTVGFLDSHSLRFTGRTIAGQFKYAHTINRDDHRKTATYTEYDLDYRWSTSWNGEISAGVKNLFNADRPLDYTAPASGRLNTSLYDQIGQLVYLGYTQTF